MRTNKVEDTEDKEFIKYLAIHDYFEDPSEFEDEYSEKFSIKLFNFKFTFAKKD